MSLWFPDWNTWAKLSSKGGHCQPKTMLTTLSTLRSLCEWAWIRQAVTHSTFYPFLVSEGWSRSRFLPLSGFYPFLVPEGWSHSWLYPVLLPEGWSLLADSTRFGSLTKQNLPLSGARKVVAPSRFYPFWVTYKAESTPFWCQKGGRS